MKQYQSTWNGTMTQARALVEAWKIEQKEKERKKKMAAWFSKNAEEWAKRDLIFEQNNMQKRKYGKFSVKAYRSNIEIFEDGKNSGRVLFMECTEDTPYKGITNGIDLGFYFGGLTRRGQIAFIKREGGHDGQIVAL